MATAALETKTKHVDTMHTSFPLPVLHYGMYDMNDFFGVPEVNRIPLEAK